MMSGDIGRAVRCFRACLKIDEDVLVHEMCYRAYLQEGNARNALRHALRIYTLIEGEEKEGWVSKIRIIKTNLALDSQTSGISYFSNKYGGTRMKLSPNRENYCQTWIPLSPHEALRLKQISLSRGKFSQSEWEILMRGINDINDPVSKYFIN